MRVNELASELLIDCVQTAKVKIVLTQMEINAIKQAIEDDTKPYIILEIRGTSEHYNGKLGEYDVTLLVDVEK